VAAATGQNCEYLHRCTFNCFIETDQLHYHNGVQLVRQN